MRPVHRVTEPRPSDKPPVRRIARSASLYAGSAAFAVFVGLVVGLTPSRHGGSLHVVFGLTIVLTACLVPLVALARDRASARGGGDERYAALTPALAVSSTLATLALVLAALLVDR